MATFRPQYLTNPKILRSIETRRLRALLAPHRDYFRERGLDLCPRSSSPLDLENLIGILSAPTSETPQLLLVALPKQLKAIEHDLDNLYEAKRRDRLSEHTESQWQSLSAPARS